MTYDGDVFERGTLTGGYTNTNSLVLNSYNELRGIERKIAEEQGNIDEKRKLYTKYLGELNRYKNDKKEIELKVNRR